MNIKRVCIIAISVLFLISLIICFWLVLNYRAQEVGLFCLFDKPIRYKMTIEEIKGILGNPSEITKRSDGSTVLQYNIPTCYKESAEANFVFAEKNKKLCKVNVKITLGTKQEATELFEVVKRDVTKEYEDSIFFFDRKGSLGGNVIGANYFGICLNAVEFMIENETTIILSGWLS